MLKLVDLASEVEVNNMIVAETRSEMEPAGKVPQAAAVVLLDEAGQEPIVGYEYQ